MSFPGSRMTLLVKPSRCSLAVAAVFLATVAPTSAQTVQFNRDIRPILSDTCFQCHGPDKAKRKAKVHFDTEDGAQSVIAAGKPGESELIRRITSTDPEQRMPPPASGHALTPPQIKLLTQWVAE